MNLIKKTFTEEVELEMGLKYHQYLKTWKEGWGGLASKKKSQERTCVFIWRLGGHIKGTVEECTGEKQRT